MNEITILHQKAMEFADEARLAKMEGKKTVAQGFFEKAYALESEAVQKLDGDDDSATEYLRRNSYDNLYQSFYPKTKNEIEKTGVDELFGVIIKKYNRIPLVKKVDFDLLDYITIKTIDGIFY